MADSYEFPVEYLTELDQVLLHGTYAGRYQAAGAEFVSARSVKVPTLSVLTSTVADYSRFASDKVDSKVSYEIYTLANDKEATFYIDALDDADQPVVDATRIVAEYLRTVFNPYIDRKFFSNVAAKAGTQATANLTKSNIKGEIRKIRKTLMSAGLSGGDLYMTSDALALLEEATDRQWSNEGQINDVVGSYDGFEIIEAPDDLMFCDMLLVNGGQQAARHVVKRSVSYMFAPGQHTQGDGWLVQMRWLFDDIVRKNAAKRIYALNYDASKAAAALAAYDASSVDDDLDGDVDDNL